MFDPNKGSGKFRISDQGARVTCGVTGQYARAAMAQEGGEEGSKFGLFSWSERRKVACESQ